MLYGKFKRLIRIIFLLILYLNQKYKCEINIHVIPHTHLDPGWLKTPEQYYSEENIEDIFNTILKELEDDSEKTFVINELYYFKIWYSNIGRSDKKKFKNLVKEKRIEFVSGSYIINDEATPLYYNIMDQIRIGHQFLLEEFGILPKTGWYIDSFGHSGGNAHILSLNNFENLVLGRMHVDFLELMKKEKKTEFYWEPFGNNSTNKKILTHILPMHYGYELYLLEIGQENGEFKNNLKYIFDKLIDYIKESARGLNHNNIMYLYGDDFKFKDNNLFLNLEEIMKVFKNPSNDIMSSEKIKEKFEVNDEINIFYSTPEKYFEFVQKELSKNNKKLETYSNIDFYPLKSDCYWTGFFTSRPYLKGCIRKGSNIFYTLSKYHSFNKLINAIESNKEILSNLNNFREVVGLSQHHDAITGTCMQYVASDYIKRIENIIENSEKDFLKSVENKYDVEIKKICYNNYIANDNDCSQEFTISQDLNDKKIKIGLYNPKSFSSSNLLINIEITDSNREYEIEGIKSDFFCIDKQSIENFELFKYKSKCFLNFFYEFKSEFETITLIKTEKIIQKEKYIKFNIDNNENIELIKKHMNIQNLSFSPKNFEFHLEYLNEEQNINKLNFTYYDGMYYVNSGSCLDGAYIFSPYNKYPDEIKIDYNNSFYYKGELGITFVTRNEMASFTIFTIFYNPFFAKVEHIFDSLEKNYFLKRFSFSYSFVLKTNINNLDEDQKPIFYTDANGLEAMKRVIDKFEFKESDPVSTGGNFYPVTSFITIQDENKKENPNRVTIFTDRAQGGTGYLPGSLILVIQKMSYTSDNRGLIENMYEIESMNNENFKTTHFIVFGNNINKINEKNENNYMIQKTDLINFIYNYFNTATIMFKINNINKIMEIEDKMKKENNVIDDLINKYLIISPDIRSNFELINNNLIIGEFFRYNINYFNKNNNKEYNESFGTISMNFNNDAKFKIYYDKTGLYYNKKEESLSEEIKDKLKSPNNLKLSIERNEFLYIYFYFE